MNLSTRGLVLKIACMLQLKACCEKNMKTQYKVADQVGAYYRVSRRPLHTFFMDAQSNMTHFSTWYHPFMTCLRDATETAFFVTRVTAHWKWQFPKDMHWSHRDISRGQHLMKLLTGCTWPGKLSHNWWWCIHSKTMEFRAPWTAASMTTCNQLIVTRTSRQWSQTWSMLYFVLGIKRLLFHTYMVESTSNFFDILLASFPCVTDGSTLQ